jgi:hypothetical protein
MAGSLLVPDERATPRDPRWTTWPRGYLRARIAKRPDHHLDLSLVRRVVGVALDRRHVAMTHPLLQCPHRHPGGGHRGPERVAQVVEAMRGLELCGFSPRR